MPDLRGFAGRIRVKGKRVEENADALVRKVAVAVDTAVVLATPVDTGRARANWQVEIGDALNDQEGPPYVPGEGGSSGSANAMAAIEAGKNVIKQYKGGSEIHIYNNLSYIQKLNDGHSAQAPAGFVEAAVLAGVAMAQGASAGLTDAIQENL